MRCKSDRKRKKSTERYLHSKAGTYQSPSSPLIAAHRQQANRPGDFKFEETVSSKPMGIYMDEMLH